MYDRCLVQLLLRKKAAEELKKEQERKAAERKKIIDQRCGKPKNVDDANEGKGKVVHGHRKEFLAGGQKENLLTE
jgi:hypothetical protein